MITTVACSRGGLANTVDAKTKCWTYHGGHEQSDGYGSEGDEHASCSAAVHD